MQDEFVQRETMNGHSALIQWKYRFFKRDHDVCYTHRLYAALNLGTAPNLGTA